MRKFEENYTTTDGENHKTFEGAKEHQARLDRVEVIKLIQPLKKYLVADEDNNIIQGPDNENLDNTIEEIAGEIMQYI